MADRIDRAGMQQYIGDGPPGEERYYVYLDGKLIADFAHDERARAYAFLDGVRTVLAIQEEQTWQR